MNREAAYLAEKYLVRKNLLGYTRKAYEMLSQIECPNILDIGCGTGIPTLEIASLSGGNITAIDIDEQALDTLRREAEKAGLADSIRVMNCSINDMDFPDEKFDILLSEGSIFIIGFEKGLREWKRFLKPGGCMIIHDDQKNINKKLQLIRKCGYEVLGYFTLDNETWWREYFTPMERLVEKTLGSCSNDSDVPAIVFRDRQEIEMVRRDPEAAMSAVFVIKKVDS